MRFVVAASSYVRMRMIGSAITDMALWSLIVQRVMKKNKDMWKFIKKLFRRSLKIKTERLECGTTRTKMPFVVEAPEGYEFAKLDPKTGKAYYPSDGSYTDTIAMRKIPDNLNKKEQ